MLLLLAGLVSWLSATISVKVQLHREPDVIRQSAQEQPADHALERSVSCSCTLAHQDHLELTLHSKQPALSCQEPAPPSQAAQGCLAAICSRSSESE